MNSSKQNLKPNRPRGVTLIELLVVVAILSVLTAIMIPRLRVINKDRNIREAARIAGSTLSKAHGRAINEGVAGLIIERNNNFVDAAGVRYAGTRMYLMRKLPPYTGDDIGSRAIIIATSPTTMTINLPKPLEHIAPNNLLIMEHDQVRLNYNSVLYRVLSVVPGVIAGTLDVQLSLGLRPGFGAVRPTLNIGSAVPFSVYRQPRQLESSRVDLPAGYLIDLRFSGPFGEFNQANTVGNDSVRLFFDSNGAIDRYTYVDSTDTLISNVLQDAFYLYIAAYELDETTNPIFSPSNMWVSIDRSTGSINVAYNAPPPATLVGNEQLQYARGFSKTRESADQ